MTSAFQLMKDLVSVLGLLNVCADRIAEQQAYIEPMCQIINLCSKPLLKQKTSDETAYEQIAVESLAQLGQLTFEHSIVVVKYSKEDAQNLR